MITIDEDKMSEEIEGFIQAELESSDFSTNVCELVWQTYFGEVRVELTDEEDAAATEVYNRIFKECLDKMLRALKH